MWKQSVCGVQSNGDILHNFKIDIYVKFSEQFAPENKKILQKYFMVAQIFNYSILSYLYWWDYEQFQVHSKFETFRSTYNIMLPISLCVQYCIHKNSYILSDTRIVTSCLALVPQAYFHIVARNNKSFQCFPY